MQSKHLRVYALYTMCMYKHCYALKCASIPVPCVYNRHAPTDSLPLPLLFQATIATRDATIAAQLALLAERDAIIEELNSQLARLSDEVEMYDECICNQSIYMQLSPQIL